MNNEIPSLTLDPNGKTESAAVQAEAIPPVESTNTSTAHDSFNLDSLTDTEQAAVKEFSEKIDITNTEQVMNYGSAAQKNVAEFSDTALNNVRTKDLGEAGNMLSDLVVELKGFDFDESEKKGLKGLFKKTGNSLEKLKAQYDKTEVNIDRIVEELQKHEVTLMKDISLMDKMYEKNEEYIKELTMYIIAGKLKCENLKNTELAELKAKAVESGLAEDAQMANDMANLIERFEKKIYDLELTRTVAIQMEPQIRMIQNNDSVMSEKIQSSIVNTIPLWKSQMVMAMTLYHTEEATKAQNEVNEVTNKLLKENAEKLHMGSVAIAKEAERGIIDIETLRKTNLELISTLTEVQTIQKEAKEKRASAEKELSNIENQLKNKLLEINS